MGKSRQCFVKKHSPGFSVPAVRNYALFVRICWVVALSRRTIEMDWQQTHENLLRNSEVQHRIAERAYLISESRGFERGHEAEDWFRAEREIMDALRREFEDTISDVPAASALALTDSAIFEEPVAAPIAPTESEEKAPTKNAATTKRAPKNAAPKEKTASAKTRESKSVKTTASKPKPTLKKANKKPTASGPSSEVGD
jgi:hypothetical protein